MEILLTDDHSIVLNGLKILLKNELFNVSIKEAVTIESAFELIRNNKFEFAILDLNILDTFSFNFIESLKKHQPNCKTLIYSTYKEETFAIRTYKLGVDGYINKNAPIKELKFAINTIMNGKIYYSDKTKELISINLNRPNQSQSLDILSNREMEVTILLLKGKKLKFIESAMNISKSTASTFKRRIFTKLGVTNILELSDFCLEYGIG